MQCALCRAPSKINSDLCIMIQSKRSVEYRYSEISIKRTVLLNVLFEFFHKISIKRTVHLEIKAQNPKNVLFLLNVLSQICASLKCKRNARFEMRQ